ncbi:flagellar hook-length control protein FliK [Enterobacter sp. CC120223-11]|uniref:flagellar hook-length control protein FliK n=1 Tax=Enterobacter sp. CC120223-11 TaxID=1378073 RepID=UPI000BD8B9C2|nr:flagellar hook-length control protein FliK [Enterobacter sp. CC120223-11]SNY67952.1 flagellar hook-length control protein FliK [Enterobacter sp. CC120223-11]
MDLLNLSAGLNTASGTPQSAEAIGAQPQGNGEAASGNAGFSDALLNVISTLLAQQGQTLPRPNVSAEVTAIKEKDDEKDDAQATTLPLKESAPQQLLEALLMSSQMPVRAQPEPLAVSMNTAPTLSLTPNMPAMNGLAPTLTTVPALPVHAATGGETAVPLPKEMQPVTPQLFNTLTTAGVVAPAMPAVSAAPSVGASPAATGVMQHAPVHVDTEDNRWSQQLQSALGDRLQIQVKNQIQHATIRLDPPDMGKIDISLQVDNGRMQVQINASHAEVYRALQQTSNDLRQSLTEQNFIQVNVQVSSQSGQQQGRGQGFAGEQEAAILAGNDQSFAEHDALRHDHDPVLLTV